MKLWVLRHNGCGYDEHRGFIMRARSAKKARAMAAGAAADEGPNVWRDATRSTCEELTLDGAEGVVMSDFNAG